MGRWWVSRGAYDEVVGERNRLRQKNDELLDQLVRIARRREKLPEVTPQGKRKQLQEELPADVAAIRDLWDSPAHRTLAERRARQKFAETGSWEEAKKAITPDGFEDEL